MSEFEKLLKALNTENNNTYRHVNRAAVLNCRALQVDGQRDESGNQVAGQEKMSSLRDLCLRTVIQGIKDAKLSLLNIKTKFGNCYSYKWSVIRYS